MVGRLEEEGQQPYISLKLKNDHKQGIRKALEPNLILEGRICSGKYAEKGSNGANCTFDRSNITGNESIRPVVRKHEELVTSEAKGEIDSCPICAFMKAGPCGKLFEEWTSCMDTLSGSEGVSKCAHKTVAMTSCMRQFEYYDIFMAGMSEKLDYLDSQQSS
jgi:hypothetical protein